MAEASFLRRVLIALGLAAPEQASAAPVAAAPEQSRRSELEVDESRLPSQARERLAQIRSLIQTIEARAGERRGIGDMSELDRIKSAHLPRLLNSYIEIPAEYRAEVFRETGRSASYLLNEQLDKMIARLKEMSKMLARGDLDAFTQNIRFIDNQYGSGFSPFD
jgi:hypothetical protein